MQNSSGGGWPPIVNRLITDGRGSLVIPDGKIIELRSGITVTEDGCWEYSGIESNSGYGRLNVLDRYWYTHRLSYELHVGPIPAGQYMDHLCRNKVCCNPRHLEPVTPRENVLRSPVAPAALNARKTHCVHGHELTGYNLMFRNDGKGRRCRTCHNRQCREAKQRMAARRAAERTGASA